MTTWPDVSQAFLDLARAKIAKSKDRSLSVEQWPHEVIVVVSGPHRTSEAVAGPSLDSLAHFLADLPTIKPVSYGGGEPVAYLFEPSVPSLLVIGAEETPKNVEWAVKLAMTWVW